MQTTLGTERVVDIRVVPGNHSSILQEPNVVILASALNACLESIEPVASPRACRSGPATRRNLSKR